MADMTLEQAMALADQDCPLPQLAGEALKVLREHAKEAQMAVFGILLAEAIHTGRGRASFGRWAVGVDLGAEKSVSVLAYRDEQGVMHVLEEDQDVADLLRKKDC
jgi:hypothetical protein